jgi:hypothetical protein
LVSAQKLDVRWLHRGSVLLMKCPEIEETDRDETNG